MSFLYKLCLLPSFLGSFIIVWTVYTPRSLSTPHKPSVLPERFILLRDHFRTLLFSQVWSNEASVLTAYSFYLNIWTQTALLKGNIVFIVQEDFIFLNPIFYKIVLNSK